jgi:hypothetical protein
VVHDQGALAGLAEALLLGPRIGKFVDGKPHAIPGHNTAYTTCELRPAARQALRTLAPAARADRSAACRSPLGARMPWQEWQVRRFAWVRSRSLASTEALQDSGFE